MEKKILLLIGAVVIISIVLSFFAGAIVGTAPLGIIGGYYYGCPRWKCTSFKYSTTQQIISLNSSISFNGYDFFLRDVLSWSQPSGNFSGNISGNGTALIQVSKDGNVIDTFWVLMGQTHYTLGGNTGIASSINNTGVSYNGYTVYVLDGESGKWAQIQIKDTAGRVVVSDIINKSFVSSYFIGNSTVLKVKLVDVWTSAQTGAVYARLIVGDTDIYTTLLDAQYKSWALLKISMYYPYTYYVCSEDNPGNCIVYGGCRYCPI
jgi:hypothetical protein